MLLNDPVHFRKMKAVPFSNATGKEVQDFVQIVHRPNGLDRAQIAFRSCASNS